jgi:serine/threonine-protein kinase
MASVHLGKQTALDREVAVKSLHRCEDVVAKQALLHEAWLTGSLEHPNIVPVYDLVLDEAEEPAVVMRRIDGTDWSQLIDDPSRVRQLFAVSDVLEWHMRVLMQVCNAIHFAHSRGVIHRDIKPDNVMIGSFGEVYVVDWGIAVAKEGPLTELLAAFPAPIHAGTAAYLAPEMLTGKLENISPRTDVYLLGASLYHCVTGRPPHPGKTRRQALDHANGGEIEFPSDMSSELEEVLRRSLATDPEERYASAEEMRDALQSVLEHRSSAKLELAATTQLAELRVLLETSRLEDENSWDEAYRRFRSCAGSTGCALQL